MPPISPSLTRTNRFHPHGTRTDAANARPNATTPRAARDLCTVNADDQDLDMSNDIDQDPTTVEQAPPDNAQRPEGMSMSQLWSFLKQNNKQDNGDVVVPAHLVNIISALVLTMQETTLRMNVMEDQLKTSREATSRIDSLEQQVKALIEVQRTASSTPHPTQPTLPAKPKSWAATAAAGLKVTTNQAPQPPPPNLVINEFRPSQVIIRTLEGKKPFANVKATEIVCRVNEALDQLNVMIGGKKSRGKGCCEPPIWQHQTIHRNKSRGHMATRKQTLMVNTS